MRAKIQTHVVHHQRILVLRTVTDTYWALNEDFLNECVNARTFNVEGFL